MVVLQPFVPVPVTTYVIVEVGAATTVAPAVALRAVAGLQA